MNIEDKVMAICWLDSGSFQTRSVASRYNMSALELEEELAAFKGLEIYKNKYAGYVRKHTRQSLENSPFPTWKNDHTMRFLKNKRIECVICESDSDTEKFFHFHIPDKSYLDQICERSEWITPEEFRRELAIMNVVDWSSMSADEQLTFLVQRYDSDIFLPFSQRIHKEQFVELTGQNFPGNGDWSMSEQIRQHQTPDMYAKDKSIKTPKQSAHKQNADLGMEAYAVRSDQITALAKLIYPHGGNFIYTWENKEIEAQLDEADMSAIQFILFENDSSRLQNLAAKDPKSIEKELLYKIDGFYEYYDLQDAFAEGLQSKDFSLLRQKAQAAFDKIAEDYRKRKAVIPVAANPKSDYLDKIIMVFNQLCESGSDEDTEHAVAELESIVSRQDGNGLNEVRKQFGLFKDQMITDIRQKAESVLGIGSSTPDVRTVLTSPFVSSALTESSAQATSVQTKCGLPGQPEPFGALQEERSSLLAQIRSKGMLAELVDAFNVTERTILKYPAAGRPSFYPEQDFTLYKLYFSTTVRTEIAVMQLVTARLTPEQVNEIYNHLND